MPQGGPCVTSMSSVGHAGVQGSQAALIRHEVPPHKRWRPRGTVKANAIKNERLIQEHVYVLSEQFAHRCREQLEALIVITGNDNGVPGTLW